MPSSPYITVEQKLNRVNRQWRWKRFLQFNLILVMAVTLWVFLLGTAVYWGWISTSLFAYLWLGIFTLLSMIAWLTLTLIALFKVHPREKLARSLEKAHPGMQDRLHAIVHLEKNRRIPHFSQFIKIIRAQAGEILQREKSRPTGSYRSLLLQTLICIALIWTLTLLSNHYKPWTRLDAIVTGSITPAKEEKLVLPDHNTLEQTRQWGEVRIVDPGKDLKATKVDVIPLQIEAASSEDLQKIFWRSTLNGEGEESHPLPPPPERKYAAYQPMIYLDEFKLSDWDLFSYHARADTENRHSYASEIYFLEIRPFREDILKMPGGEGGKGFRLLSEFTGLIQKQQIIIRETHRFNESPQVDEPLKQQDQKKLTDAEQDLKNATHHFYSQLSMEMENQNIGEMLDHLAKAENSMENAVGRLKENYIPDALKDEQKALSELASARKNLQKSISENPQAFDDSSGDGENPEASQKSEPENKLKEIAEFRDQKNAVLQFLEKLQQQQHELSEKAEENNFEDEREDEGSLEDTLEKFKNALENHSKPSSPDSPPPPSPANHLGDEQAKITQSLLDFENQNPSVFKGAEKELGAAKDSLQNSEQSLRRADRQAGRKSSLAEQKIQELKNTIQNQSLRQQLTDAYKVQKLLENNIQKMESIEKNPDSTTNQQAQKTSQESKEILSQLKQLAEEEPIRNAFGPSLRESLQDEKKNQLDQNLDQLSQAGDAATRQEAARQSREGLSEVNKAFKQSQPQALQEADNGKPLQNSSEDSMQKGLSQLENLIQQLSKENPISPEMASRQQTEALNHIRKALSEPEKPSSQGQNALQLVDETLRNKNRPIDAETLKKLLEELKSYSVEFRDKPNDKKEEPKVTHTDPSKLPPAYRGRIQKYFQKLSEK